MAEVTWEPLCLHTRGRPRRISRQKFPKRTRILSIPSKPYSFHSVHSAIGSRMNGMIFRSFRKWNSSQKNTNTVYSEYSYSGIVPKERTLRQEMGTSYMLLGVPCDGLASHPGGVAVFSFVSCYMRHWHKLRPCRSPVPCIRLYLTGNSVAIHYVNCC